MRWFIRLLCVLLFCVPAWAAESPSVDVGANGIARALLGWPRELPCRAGIWMVRDNWKSIQQQWDLKNLLYSAYAPSRSIGGTFQYPQGDVQLEETVGLDEIRYALHAKGGIDTTGVYWFIEIAVNTFQGGTASIGEKQLNLPAEKPAQASIGTANGSSIQIASKDGKSTIEIRFPKGREIRVQDARVFGEDRYQIYTPLIEGALVAGSDLSLNVSIHVKLPDDVTPATITLDPKTVVSEFDGFGGNFVYAIDDPTTQLTLDSLKLTWARIGIEAAKWEPANDNDDAMATDVKSLEARDVEGSALRRRFELDRKLQRVSGGRLIASLWYVPEWLYDKPLRERNQPGTIARERWDELAECITSYLLHLKTKYGVEPALFSFNESDIGIYLLLTGEEQRDLIKLLGSRFAGDGIRTKILLGDSADLKKGLEQIRPTLDDADAMKFVGALAYHPWSGQNEQWAAWADAAQRYGLMLLATEMGADAEAWHDSSFNAPIATLRLARKYIQQLRDARTQVMLEWEWTGDYAMSKRDEKGALALTNRGRFLAQLTQTTPTQSSVMAARCDASTMDVAAVVADDGKSAAVHLINLGGARHVEVRGIPPALSLATLFVIDPLTEGPTPTHIEAKDGACAFDLPAGAIATLAFPPIK